MIGLDYDRLYLTPKDQQLKYFEAQLSIAVEVQLPLFLHSRAAAEDFERLLGARLNELPKRGLVHSFTGTVEEMQRLVDLGFDIGINGCSMKSKLNPFLVFSLLSLLFSSTQFIYLPLNVVRHTYPPISKQTRQPN